MVSKAEESFEASGPGSKLFKGDCLGVMYETIQGI